MTPTPSALHHEEQGAGRPVVLLHGFTGSAASWRRTGWLDLLARNGFRAIALDFPGHGRNGRVEDARRCSTGRLAADVVALLDRLGLDRAALFGFSMGGGVALQVAMESPERVERLVVAGVGDAALNRLHDPRDISELVAAFEDHEPAAPRAAIIRRSAQLAGHAPRALLPFLRGGGWPGGLDDLRPLEPPVLVVLAERDEYMPEATAILERLPGAATVAVPRGHHDVLADEQVRSAVVAFLSGHPAA